MEKAAKNASKASRKGRGKGAKKQAKEEEANLRKVEAAAMVAGKRAQIERSGDVPYTAQLYLEGQRMLCRGLFRYFTSLRGLRQLTSPALPFGTMEECFTQRFLPLQRIPHPGVISFASFSNARKLQKTSVSLLLQVSACAALPPRTALPRCFSLSFSLSSRSPSLVLSLSLLYTQSATDAFRFAAKVMQRGLGRDAQAPVHAEPRLRRLAKVALGNAVSLSMLMKREEGNSLLLVTDGDQLNEMIQRPADALEERGSGGRSGDGSSSKGGRRRRNSKPLWWEGWHGAVPHLDFSVHPIFPIVKQ
jgi:hypothetical protein